MNFGTVYSFNSYGYRILQSKEGQDDCSLFTFLRLLFSILLILVCTMVYLVLLYEKSETMTTKAMCDKKCKHQIYNK